MLTVVMPVYNNERYIAEAVQSVLAQTYRNFTLLVCDDGSADRTAEIAKTYEAKDSRVRVLARPNQGIGNVMNDALARSTTEWVACMHGDDVMMPTRLERQLAFVTENADLSLVSCLVDWIDEEGRVVGHSRSHLTDRRAVREEIAGDGIIAFPHPGVMFRRSVVQSVGGYRQAFFPTEDVDLWNRIAEAGHGVLVQPEVLLKYRTHPQSASMSRAKAVMRNLRWSGACARARRAGQPEPTLGEFERARRALGWRGRLHDRRIDWGHAVYQKAIGHYTARQFHLMIPAMLAAIALRPQLILPRLAARLKLRRGATPAAPLPAPRPRAAGDSTPAAGGGKVGPSVLTGTTR